MKRISLYVCFMICVVVASAQEKQFQNACTKNTIEAYNKFINKYPDSKFIEDASFRIAKINNTINSYDNFLMKYPEGEFMSAAILNFYKIVVKNNTVADYEKFQGRVHGSKYAEEIAFKIALLINTADNWANFIQQYPNGSYLWNASGFYYEVIIENNNLTDDSIFLERLPDSRYSEEISYKRAILMNSLAGYTDFVNKYPEGKYTDLIQKELWSINKEIFQKRLMSEISVCINPPSFNASATSKYNKEQLKELKKTIEDHINKMEHNYFKTNCDLVIDIEFSILGQWTRRSDGSWTEIMVKCSLIDKKNNLVMINQFDTKINDGSIVYENEKVGNVTYTNMYASYDFTKTSKLFKEFIVTVNPLEISDSTKFITLHQ